MSVHKTLVLGIGNTLLTDEGVGIHVINQLQQDASAAHADGAIEYLDGGTLSFTLAEPIESCDQLIVVDASEIKDKPGTVRVFENEAMDRFITTGNKKSPHEVGLADVMSMALLTGNLPGRRALIGIQPDSLDWGSDPSEPVQQAIPLACAKVKELIAKWRS
ncbi:MAG: HyaD/HybD family hydrogenase maturation endopeptidase [Gammaproteobacteria bacterium]|nr:HyaD/HybD family hydrogenase maturation endopeptidase [Gammaproteobacteria bacterium]